MRSKKVNLKKAIFLDRDGTINYDSKNYIKNADEFQLFPYSVEALVKLYQNGFSLVIVTNQSGIARGYFTEDELHKMHHKLLSEVAKNDAKFLDIMYCPHHPDENCDCRKPKTTNILKASNEHNIDLANSWFIGDSEKDIITGKNSGCKTILVLTGIREISREKIENWNIRPDLIEDNLLTAAKKIIDLENC